MTNLIKCMLPKYRKYKKVYGKLFLIENRKVLSLRHPATLLFEKSIRQEIVKIMES